MKLLSLNSWQKTNGLFCVHMRRARDHRDDGDHGAAAPDVTRCRWYIFVWILALGNPNGGHTLRKCAQIVIQWYFEGCIRNNVRPDPPNKQLCSMSSGYSLSSPFRREPSSFLTNLNVSSISMRHLATDARSPPLLQLLPHLHRQTITQPRPSGTFLSGLKQTLSLTSTHRAWNEKHWEDGRELNHFHNVATE